MSDARVEVRAILSGITGSLVDENIVPHDKYEDAVTDDDIVLLGQQLLDDAEKAISEYTDKCTSTALDRLAAKLQTYRARSASSSQDALLNALSDDIAEEREKVRGGGRE